MFKDNLKELRKYNNFSQAELAKKLGVSLKTISHWESGYTEPSIDLIIKLKNLLKTTLEELLE